MNVSTTHCWAGNASLGLRLCVLLTGWQKPAILYCFQTSVASWTQSALPTSWGGDICFPLSERSKESKNVSMKPLWRHFERENDDGRKKKNHGKETFAIVGELRLVLNCGIKFFYVIFYTKIVFMVVTGKAEVDIIWEDKYGTTILVESIRHGLLKRLESLRSTC